MYIKNASSSCIYSMQNENDYISLCYEVGKMPVQPTTKVPHYTEAAVKSQS